MPKKTKKKARSAVEPLPKDFLDMIAPAAVKFNTDHYVLGGAYHCAMAVRGYPTTTEALALLSTLGEHSGVTLSIYIRRVTGSEEQKIIQNASNRNITSSRFLVFGVKGLLQASGSVKNAITNPGEQVKIRYARRRKTEWI